MGTSRQDWEALDALITETLAAGEHPETRVVSTNVTVDNDGNPRRATAVFDYMPVMRYPDETVTNTSHHVGRTRGHRGTGRTTRLLERAAQQSRESGVSVRVVFAHLQEGRDAVHSFTRGLDRTGDRALIEVTTLDQVVVRGLTGAFYDHRAIETMLARLDRAELAESTDPALTFEQRAAGCCRFAAERRRILALPTEGPLSSDESDVALSEYLAGQGWQELEGELLPGVPADPPAMHGRVITGYIPRQENAAFEERLRTDPASLVTRAREDRFNPTEWWAEWRRLNDEPGAFMGVPLPPVTMPTITADERGRLRAALTRFLGLRPTITDPTDCQPF